MTYNSRNGKKRERSDEYYVIDLCDEILGRKALRQHRFDFLERCNGHKLPVDAYYEELNLVIEYWERQHIKPVPFFDRKMTCCGITRGEQRKMYDRLREEELPNHGIKLVIIRYDEFGSKKRICRNHDRDVEIIKCNLMKNNVLNGKE